MPTACDCDCSLNTVQEMDSCYARRGSISTEAVQITLYRLSWPNAMFDHIAVNAKMWRLVEQHSSTLQLQPCQAGPHTGYSTCVQRGLQLVHQIIEAQHEGIQEECYGQLHIQNIHAEITYFTVQAKLKQPVLDMSPFKAAKGTGNVAKMHDLH